MPVLTDLKGILVEQVNILKQLIEMLPWRGFDVGNETYSLDRDSGILDIHIFMYDAVACQ